ncbi:MAG TPA: hypothetical protein VI322_02285 [Candidatus Saccharimonadia bacterium]
MTTGRKPSDTPNENESYLNRRVKLEKRIASTGGLIAWLLFSVTLGLAGAISPRAVILYPLSRQFEVGYMLTVLGLAGLAVALTTCTFLPALADRLNMSEPEGYQAWLRAQRAATSTADAAQ